MTATMQNEGQQRPGLFHRWLPQPFASIPQADSNLGRNVPFRIPQHPSEVPRIQNSNSNFPYTVSYPHTRIKPVRLWKNNKNQTVLFLPSRLRVSNNVLSQSQEHNKHATLVEDSRVNVMNHCHPVIVASKDSQNVYMPASPKESMKAPTYDFMEANRNRKVIDNKFVKYLKEMLTPIEERLLKMEGRLEQMERKLENIQGKGKEVVHNKSQTWVTSFNNPSNSSSVSVPTQSTSPSSSFVSIDSESDIIPTPFEIIPSPISANPAQAMGTARLLLVIDNL